MAVTAANFQNEIGAALNGNSDRLVFNKPSLSSQLTGGFTSMWRSSGVPAQGAIPAAAALCTKATVGAFAFENTVAPVENNLAWAYASQSVAGNATEIHDRLAAMGGLSGTLTTAQNPAINLETLALPAKRIGAVDYSDVLWWLEWYTATGSTAVTATVNVTYSDGTTGNITVSIPASTAASRMIPILSAVAQKFIKGVNTVTLSASTLTAGSFGITATRHRTSFDNETANRGKNFPWYSLGCPVIEANSCLFFVVLCTSTTSGAITGQMKLAKV